MKKKTDMEELWKPIDGYEGYYEVSNLGVIRSVEHYVTRKNGVSFFCRQQIILPFKDRKGYLEVILYKGGRSKHIKVHRAVALAFIPQIQGKAEINHKDENKENNSVPNLEWCDHLSNIRYGTGIERGRTNRTPKIRKTVGKPILMIDLNGNIVKRYECISDVCLDHISSSHVTECCKGKRKMYKQHYWKFENGQ